MKIVLFDQINETHVCESLVEALVRLGHEVRWTGPIWKGHRFPEGVDDIGGIDARLEELLAWRPDALLNFRASSLLPAQLQRLRRAGVRTLVWFPDDPVLYGLCYGQVVDYYDVPLHCGSRQVLDFYRYRGHRVGVNFPFWLDPQAVPYRYDVERCEGTLVFFGNMHGPAKQGRYEAFCALHEDIAFYGKLPQDPHGRGRGQLDGIGQALEVLPRYRIGLNSAQRFGDYAGSAYDFPGLGMLGSFFLPSRVLQYAALGLPVLSLHAPQADLRHYPPGLHARSVEEARAVVARVAHDDDYLQALSRAARRELEQHHGADARARLLERIVWETVRPERLTAHEQEFIYRCY